MREKLSLHHTDATTIIPIKVWYPKAVCWMKAKYILMPSVIIES